jgi:hypothetical protein
MRVHLVGASLLLALSLNPSSPRLAGTWTTPLTRFGPEIGDVSLLSQELSKVANLTTNEGPLGS